MTAYPVYPVTHYPQPIFKGKGGGFPNIVIDCLDESTLTTELQLGKPRMETGLPMGNLSTT